MTLLRKLVPAQVNALGDDEVEVRMSTAALARDGHILVPQGCILDNYRANPIVLWQHDPEHPVANAESVSVGNEDITARIRFAPAGISHKADEVRGLVKAGIVRAVSVGFEPLDGEPLDPKRPRGGQRFSKWELLECSFVSVPADTGAVVTARAHGERIMAEWKCGTSRNFSVQDSDDWDGAAAEKSIFEACNFDGDKPDTAKARKAFLFYDSENPTERGSYKDPIAHVVDGKFVVPKGAIRAAASRLPQTDVPDDVKKRAESVLNAYKKKAKIGDEEDGDRARRQSYTRMFGPAQKRDLIGVSNFAWVLFLLANTVHGAQFEAALEGDDSELPDVLAKLFEDAAAAFCAMADEEIAEEIAAFGGDDDDAEDMTDGEHAFVGAARSDKAKSFRRSLIRAGKVLSKTNSDQLDEASDHHARALKHHRSATEAHGSVGDGMEKARSALKKAADAIGDAGDGANHVRAAAKALDGAADSHEDVGDAHRGMARCIRSAERCVRSVLDGATPGEDADSKDVQDAGGGDAEDEGSRSADFRKRQADLLSLTH